MNELQRQAWIQALGVTPWVARQPLPGAREAQQLPWPEAAEPGSAASTGSAAGQQVPPAPAAPPKDLAAVLAPAAEKAAPTTAQQPVEPAPSETPAQAIPLTLQLHSVGDLVLAVEQSDPGAPGLGREAHQLLVNLLKVFPAQARRLNRFSWPMLDQPDDALALTFQHFVAHLAGAPRVLLCLSEQNAERLGAAPRYRIQQWDGQTVLAISSLEEMLALPTEHKPRSWHAMLEHGFARQDT